MFKNRRLKNLKNLYVTYKIKMYNLNPKIRIKGRLTKKMKKRYVSKDQINYEQKNRTAKSFLVFETNPLQVSDDITDK